MLFSFGLLLGTAGGGIFLTTLNDADIKKKLGLAFGLQSAIFSSMLVAWLFYHRFVCTKPLLMACTNLLSYVLLVLFSFILIAGSDDSRKGQITSMFVGNIGIGFSSMLGYLNCERQVRLVLGTEYRKQDYRFSYFLRRTEGAQALGVLVGALWSSQIVMTYFSSK